MAAMAHVTFSDLKREGKLLKLCYQACPRHHCVDSAALDVGYDPPCGGW